MTDFWSGFILIPKSLALLIIYTDGEFVGFVAFAVIAMLGPVAAIHLLAKLRR